MWMFWPEEDEARYAPSCEKRQVRTWSLCGQPIQYQLLSTRELERGGRCGGRDALVCAGRGNAGKVLRLPQRERRVVATEGHIPVR